MMKDRKIVQRNEQQNGHRVNVNKNGRAKQKIIVAEPFLITALCLAKLVEDEFGYETVVLTNSSEIIHAVRESSPKLLITEFMFMFGEKGGIGMAALLGTLKAEFPKLPSLVLSSAPERIFALRCLEWGAKGYLHKSVSKETLFEGIGAVLAGNSFVSKTVNTLLLQSIGAGSKDNLVAKLSPREAEVLASVSQCLSPAQIAESLSLSVKTVECYLGNIKMKLGFKNAGELRKFAGFFVNSGQNSGQVD
ncbi:MAG: response regulator transcription factor [bacterium]|nr:response regulator transcription factor [bacterium]